MNLSQEQIQNLINAVILITCSFVAFSNVIKDFIDTFKNREKAELLYMIFACFTLLASAFCGILLIAIAIG